MPSTIIGNMKRFGGTLEECQQTNISWLSCTIKDDGDKRITHLTVSAFPIAAAYNDVCQYRVLVVAGALYGKGEDPLEAVDTGLGLYGRLKNGYVLFEFVGRKAGSIDHNFEFTGDDYLSSGGQDVDIVVLFGLQPDERMIAALTVNGCVTREYQRPNI